MIMGCIDQLRSEGFAVESIVRVLREQRVKIAARTYRAWKRPVIAMRTVTDAIVLGAVREAAWATEVLADATLRRKMTPEGLYGRKKMTALIRRATIADASRGAVDRAMRALGLSGIPRAKAIRTAIPAKDGIRAGDLLNRDFTAPRPDHTGVTDFTYVRTWAGWVYVAFILDVYSQRIVAWHAHTSKHVGLVMIPLRMALLGARPKTPTAYCASTSPKAPTCPGGPPTTSKPSPWHPTTDPARPRLENPGRGVQRAATLTPTTPCCTDRLNSPNDRMSD